MHWISRSYKEKGDRIQQFKIAYPSTELSDEDILDLFTKLRDRLYCVSILLFAY